MNWVYAAYGVTWAVHIAYLIYLTRAYQRVRHEVEELERR